MKYTPEKISINVRTLMETGAHDIKILRGTPEDIGTVLATEVKRIADTAAADSNHRIIEIELSHIRVIDV